jgi:hypothetical protein
MTVEGGAPPRGQRGQGLDAHGEAARSENTNRGRGGQGVGAVGLRRDFDDLLERLWWSPHPPDWAKESLQREIARLRQLWADLGTEPAIIEAQLRRFEATARAQVARWEHLAENSRWLSLFHIRRYAEEAVEGLSDAADDLQELRDALVNSGAQPVLSSQVIARLDALTSAIEKLQGRACEVEELARLQVE